MKPRKKSTSIDYDLSDILRTKYPTHEFIIDSRVIRKINQWLTRYADHPELDINSIITKTFSYNPQKPLPEKLCPMSTCPVLYLLARTASSDNKSQELFELFLEKIPAEKLRRPFTITLDPTNPDTQHNLMHIVAYYNKKIPEKVVTRLIELKVDTHAATEKLQNTPINYAAQKGNLHLIQLFKKLGTNLSFSSEEKNPILQAQFIYEHKKSSQVLESSQEMKDLKQIIALLESEHKGKEPIEKINPLYILNIGLLASKNRTDALKEELAKLRKNEPNIDLNKKLGTNGFTLLMMAIKTPLENIRSINYLLDEEKVDTHIDNNAGENALEMAIKQRHPNIIQKLLTTKDSIQDIRPGTLFIALNNKCPKEIESLSIFNLLLAKVKTIISIQEKMKLLNSEDKDKNTLLHKAILNDKQGFIKLFIAEDKLIDINKKAGANNLTPIELVVQLNKTHLIQILSKSPSLKIDAKNITKIALKHSSFSALTLLIEKEKISGDNLLLCFNEVMNTVSHHNASKKTELTDLISIIIGKLTANQLQPLLISSLQNAIACNSTIISDALIKRCTSEELTKEQGANIIALAEEKEMRSLIRHIQLIHPGLKKPDNARGAIAIEVPLKDPEIENEKKEQQLQNDKRALIEEFDRYQRRLVLSHQEYEKLIADVPENEATAATALYQEHKNYIETTQETLDKQIITLTNFIERIKRLTEKHNIGIRKQNKDAKFVPHAEKAADNKADEIPDDETDDEEINEEKSQHPLQKSNPTEAPNITTKDAKLQPTPKQEKLLDKKQNPIEQKTFDKEAKEKPVASNEKKAKEKSARNNESVVSPLKMNKKQIEKQTQATNIKYTLALSQALIKRIPIGSEKNLLDSKFISIILQKNLQKESFRNIFAIKLLLESFFIEFALNTPIKQAYSYSQWQQRNTALYKLFNDENQTFVNLLEEKEKDIPMVEKENLTQAMAKLYSALIEYHDFFDSQTGAPKKEKNISEMKSDLLQLLTAPSIDPRNIPVKVVAAAADPLQELGFFPSASALKGAASQMLSTIQTLTFQSILQSGCIRTCNLLSPPEMDFAEEYIRLRHASSAVKAKLAIDPQHKKLADKWRHPSDTPREEISIAIRSGESLDMGNANITKNP